MFPQQVQRFNNNHGDGALKVVPGMLHVHQLSDCIAQEHCLSLLAPMPLLTGDTTRAALEKRRDTAIACVKALLDTAAFAGSLSPEERALFDVVVALLRAVDQPDFQSRSLDGAVEALRALFAPRQSSRADEGAAVPISHGSGEDLQDLESLLLAGKRSEAIDAACQRGMWAHALIVASCTGKKDWQSVV
ncbi:vesicle coat component, partial [Coemansia helicoidea]